MQRRVQKLACRMADYVLANADAVRDWLVTEGYDRKKITVIRNGIDLGAPTVSDAVPGLRTEFGFSNDAPLVAVLARLNPLKGVEYFLEAAVMVKEQFPEARFLILGDGQHKPVLEDYATKLGLADQVIFTGFRRDVARVLSQIQVSVLPSLSEGLSNTLLESMAAGVPVIATLVGGNSEAVKDAGLLVPPRDSQALAQAICGVLGDRALATRLGQAGRQRIVSSFSLEKMVRDTEDFYREILQRRSKDRCRTAVAEAA
jgi:glycosyltransferase involved in cell wall biosynthesis